MKSTKQKDIMAPLMGGNLGQMLHTHPDELATFYSRTLPPLLCTVLPTLILSLHSRPLQCKLKIALFQKCTLQDILLVHEIKV